MRKVMTVVDTVRAKSGELLSYCGSAEDFGKIDNAVYHAANRAVNDKTAIMLSKNRYKNIDSLRRNRDLYHIEQWYGVWAGPLGLILKTYPLWARRIVRKLMALIKFKINQYEKQKILRAEQRDDAIRYIFKAVHKCVSEGDWINQLNDVRSAKLFVGLHTMGGPQPYTKEEVRSEVLDWIAQPDDKVTFGRKNKHKKWIISWLDEKIRSWCSQELTSPKRERLPFEEYIDDITRWATPGGAPGEKIDGVKFKNKWAWGYAQTKEFGSVHSWYAKNKRKRRQFKNIIALKEESGKTRSVISTPMCSHLRQSYLLSELGDMPIKSTFTDHNILFSTYSNNWQWYGALDASLFDHNVPKWLITLVFRLIGKYRPDLRTITDDEIEYLENSTIELFGEELPYRNGLLSGWKWTSLLGSVISCLTAEFIARTNPISDYCTQGDDIILFSRGNIDSKKILAAALDIGVITNKGKCMFGQCGEFLKKLYSKNSITSYPTRAIRAIFYANPWIDSYQMNNAQSISNSWWTLISRLIPYTGIDIMKHSVKLIVSDLTRWSGQNKRDRWEKFLQTPNSVGGGGSFDYVLYKGLPTQLTFQTTDYDADVDTQYDGINIKDRNLMKALGIQTNQNKILKNSKLNQRQLKLYHYQKLNGPPHESTSWVGYNRFKSYMHWSGIDWGGETLGKVKKITECRWPRWVNIKKVNECISWDMTKENYGIILPLRGDALMLKRQMQQLLNGIERWSFSRHHKPGIDWNIIIGLSIFINTNTQKTYFSTW